MSRNGKRRDFFRFFAEEINSLVAEARGVPQLLLDDVEHLPVAKLRQVVPVVMDHVQLAYRKSWVVAAIDEARTVELFAATSAELEIFNRFDGSRSIGKICDHIAASASMPPEQAFELVAQLFLRLVREGVCRPANPVY